jgi:SAM-dependent methyltransferase
LKLSKEEKNKIIDRYTRRYREQGYSPATLGWGKGGRQDIRFNVLAGVTDLTNVGSVLDVGCGFADFYEFIKARGFKGKYVGVELVNVLAEEARKKNKDIEIIEGDFLSIDIHGKFDLSIASGIFNAMCHRNMYQYIKESLKKMLNFSKLVAVDFMSTHVGYQQDVAFHSDPKEIIDIAKSITRRFIVRYDYMPYEFALFLYKDDSISEDNIFSSHIKNKQKVLNDLPPNSK